MGDRFFALDLSASGALMSLNPTNDDNGVLDRSGGTLTFSAAIPEPSTALALVAVCGVIGGLRRMRRSA
jgi:hypothetical protein